MPPLRLATKKSGVVTTAVLEPATCDVGDTFTVNDDEPDVLL